MNDDSLPCQLLRITITTIQRMPLVQMNWSNMIRGITAGPKRYWTPLMRVAIRSNYLKMCAGPFSVFPSCRNMQRYHCGLEASCLRLFFQLDICIDWCFIAHT